MSEQTSCRAFELAGAAAYTFCGTPPRFVSLDRVEFFKAVEVGSLVRLNAKVGVRC